MNLWAEFDDNPDSALHTLRQPHARRLTENAVQTAVRDWLLQDYAASYCRSLAATRIFRRCYWVDALGTRPTIYTNTVIPAPASLINDSPAVRSTKGRSKKATQHIPFMLQPIHELSQALAQESRPITLHGLILEAGSGKRASTKVGQKDQHVPGKGPVIPKEGGLVHAGWLETAPAILQTIDQSAAIFLLQPFGKTIFSHQDLAPLYTRTAPTELCLLISHKQVEVHLLPSLRTPTGASAFTTLLRTDRWKSLLTGDQDIEHIINALIKALIASMQQHFLAVQPIAFPMQIGRAVVELAPATLVFATRRQDSLACMNDAVCLYRRRLDQQSHRGVLMEDWFAMQQQQRLDDQFQLLYDRIVQAGQTQRTRRWPELRQRLLLASFGQHTVNDYDQVMNKLISSGKVRCEWRQVSPINSGMEEQRIPGNEDTLLWV